MMIVVGQDEMEARAVNVRNRDADKKARGKILPLDEAVSKLVKLKTERRIENNIESESAPVPAAAPAAA
jgi:threonyl-tRNA synthetase